MSEVYIPMMMGKYLPYRTLEGAVRYAYASEKDMPWKSLDRCVEACWFVDYWNTIVTVVE